MNINVQKVSDSKLLKKFIDFPHSLYADDPNYVPALYISEKFLLTKHPFHQHSEMQLFLAYQGNEIVGRIAAIHNTNYNQFNKKQDGFFGFFECINNQKVADALFSNAVEWLKLKNLSTIIGPVNPSTNETCGLLIDGFDTPPVVMMAYNPPYYQKLIEQFGFTNMTNLLAYEIKATQLDDKPVRLINTLKNRLVSKGITFRTVNINNFKNEVRSFKEVYNQAWDKNLGFVPMTDAEFYQMGKDAKMILDKEFCLVAEHAGRIVGFALAIPDINQIQRKLKKGRLFPTGFLKILLGKSKINTIRILALGVLEDYRKLGIEAVFYGSIIQNGLKKNITTAEASWILENNVMMNRAMQNINGNMYKKYSIFEKNIEA